MNARERRARERQAFALRHALTDGDALLPGHYETLPGGVTTVLAVVKDAAQFDGMPIWMASLQRTLPGGRALLMAEWSGDEISAAEAALLTALGSRGEPKRERMFATSATLVVVRAISGREWETLPVAFHDAEPITLTGGPVAVVRENWHSRPAAYPCENPTKGWADTWVWHPVDCGRCEPCIDRAGMESERARVRREKAERERAERAYEAFIATPEGLAWLARHDAESRARGDS